MGRTRAVEDLTPEAKAERAERMIAAGVRELIAAELARGAGASEWVDQNHSPLGRRIHLRLAREGRLPSRKVRRRVLILRKDLNAYIEREGLARGHRPEDEDVSEIVDRIVKGKGGRT